ncbi:MAG TPA: hypothetical protein VFD38_20470 [Myxococcaceae bacterium]|nr:hypothetical protein [Myxococcaceae bacterium]
MSDRELEALRAAWAARSPTSPGPDCPPAAAIWEAVAGARPENEVRTMLAHSIQCPDCSALWRLARELHASSRDVAPATGGEVVPLQRRRVARWVALGGTLAAAAALALVLIPRGTGRAPEPVVRGTQGTTLRADPATSTLERHHPVLRWSGAPEGSRYTVVVSTRDLTMLYRQSGVVATELKLPPDALAPVPAGGEIVWRVEAIAPGGGRTSSEAFVSRVQ